MDSINRKNARDFINMLYHDDRNSSYFICNYSGGRMQQRTVAKDEINVDDLPKRDCYISLNGFVCHHRRKNECRQINAIVFDLDCHDETNAEKLNWQKQHNLNIIFDAIDEKRLCVPNIITDTGRGYQLLYILENSISYKCVDGSKNAKAMYCYDIIRNKLHEQLEGIMTDLYALEIDKSVFDITRIIRVPGTLNSHTNTYAKIIYKDEDFYKFNDFGIIQSSKARKKNRVKTTKLTKMQERQLNIIRIDELQRLQRYRNYECENYRELMSFLYYNSASQVYDREKAIDLLHDFCNMFVDGTQPLRDSEVEALIRGVDNNACKEYTGYYKLNKQWIIDKLNITELEISELELFNTKSIKRKAAKEANRQNKAERDKIICDMATNGMAHKEIAKCVTTSVRTVQNVLKSFGLTRSYSQNLNVQKSVS